MKWKWMKRLLSLALASLLLMPVGIPFTASAAETDSQVEKGYEEQLLPIMGWSSWNAFANKISEESFIEQMDLMEEYGLIDVGYNYFNIDDGYQAGRDPQTGIVRTNYEKFPNGMKYIADYAHKLGMKAGIYSDAGDNTCASRANGEGNSDYQNKPGTGGGIGVGLYQHDEADLRQYFGDWGFDFIKVDWCGGQNVGWNNAQRIERYIEIGKTIEKLRQEYGRDLNYNVCCWTFPWDDNGGDAATVLSNIQSSYADSWRTGGDLWADFDSVLNQIDNIRTQNIAQYSGPGYHHDLDMMQVGRGMTYAEDVTHFSMWCMMSSPLMIGTDLTKISDEALEILKNEEMIAIDQDPAGLCAQYKGKEKNVEYWVKDLGKKDSNVKAIALMNRSDTAQTVSVKWSDYDLNGKVLVRDLWQHKYLNVAESYTVTIPAHGTVVYKVEAEAGATGGDGGSSIVEGTATVTVGAKQTAMNLTALGTGDWIYYGNANGQTTRRKAGVTEQLYYAGNLLGQLNATDCYNDAYTAYSWTDGTDGSGTNVKSGMTVGKAVGTYGQIDAPADERERTLYVPITGWQSSVKIEVTLGGKLIHTETVEPTNEIDGQPRVSRLVTVTYSAEEQTVLSVKWSVTKQHNNRNGNVAMEAAALTAVEGDVITAVPGDKPVEGETDTAYIGGYTAKKLVKAGAILIDVRSAAEFEAGHIEGAVNIPWSADFIKTVKQQYPDPATEIIVYCLTGKRSYQSRDSLQYNGYTNVHDLGSMEHWDAKPQIIFTDYSKMIFPNTSISLAVNGAENDKTTLRYSIGADSTVANSVMYTAPFALNATGDVTLKAYLMFEGEVVAQASCDYLVFDPTLPALNEDELFYCSNVAPLDAYVAYATVGNDTSSAGGPIVIAGKTFAKGISTHAPANVTYAIPEGSSRFVAVAGMDDDVKNAATYSVHYSIYVDGKQVDRTVTLPIGCYYVFDIALPDGAKELTMVCEQGNSSLHKNTNMHSEWGIAAFVYEYTDDERAAAKKVEQMIAELGEITSVTQADAVNAAAKAYDALGYTVQSLVSNYGDLVRAQAALELVSAVKIEAEQTKLIHANIITDSSAADASGQAFVAEQGAGSGELTFTYYASVAGKRDFRASIRQSAARTFDIQVGNGEKVTVPCPNTGAWNGAAFAFSTIVELDFAQGLNTVTITLSEGQTYWPHLDYFLIENPENKDGFVTDADQNAALGVTNKINALGENAAKADIDAAKAAYDALTELQKVLVSKEAIDKLNGMLDTNPIEPPVSTLAGDVDGDGNVNVSDIIKVKNLIMAGTWTDEELSAGDMNENDELDVADIIAIKNIIMGA